MFALIFSACPPALDDDDAALDDDDATGDDDDATGDDDDATGDDDDATGDDDDATGDDDDATGDDDDATGDDDDATGDDDDSAAGLCSERTGGAVLTLLAYTDTISIWMTDSTFIDEAITRVGTNNHIVLLSTPLDGTDCDAAWSWHPDPAYGGFTNSAPFNPACIGSPSDVEADLAGYQAASAGWCPLEVGVVSVSDQR